MNTGKTHNNPARAGGYSLVELMVALTIGLIILAAVTSLFAVSKSSYNTLQGLDALQENGRYAVRALTDDVRLAGYAGLVYDPTSITTKVYSTTVTNQCATNWVDMGQPIFGINANSVTHNANPYGSTCIAAAKYKAGTDILIIRHLNPQTTTAAAANTIYMLTQLDRAEYFTGTAVPAGTTPSSVHEMNIHVYYIRPYATVVGDGIPTLVRSTLIPGPTMVEQPLVEGVENMQVSYGIDTTSPGDYVVDRYVTANNVTNWAQVVSVRIEFLVRTPSTEGTFTNTNSYTLGDITVPAANDRYRRGLFSTTIMLRNHRKSS